LKSQKKKLNFAKVAVFVCFIFFKNFFIRKIKSMFAKKQHV